MSLLAGFIVGHSTALVPCSMVTILDYQLSKMGSSLQYNWGFDVFWHVSFSKAAANSQDSFGIKIRVKTINTTGFLQTCARCLAAPPSMNSPSTFSDRSVLISSSMCSCWTLWIISRSAWTRVSTFGLC